MTFDLMQAPATTPRKRGRGSSSATPPSKRGKGQDSVKVKLEDSQETSTCSQESSQVQHFYEAFISATIFVCSKFTLSVQIVAPCHMLMLSFPHAGGHCTASGACHTAWDEDAQSEVPYLPTVLLPVHFSTTITTQHQTGARGRPRPLIAD